MRRTFVKYLESKIEQDPSILLITADLGYGLFDNIKEKYPNNFINCGASEQLMIGLCVGAAYEGKKPIAYSITPFLLYRPFELLRNYVNKEKLNIKFFGADNYDVSTRKMSDTDFRKLAEVLELPLVPQIFDKTFETREDLEKECNMFFSNNMVEGIVIRTKDSNFSAKFMNPAYDAVK
jgi:hypothetical protein